jgi:GAF domain-containing protein
MTAKRGDSRHDLESALERLNAAQSIDQIEAILRDSARTLIGAHGVALILRDGDFCHYVDEDAIGPLWKGQRFPMAACISGWSMLKRQTVCIADITLDRRIPHNLYEKTFVQSLVMTPIGTNPPVGALGAYWGHVYTAQPHEVATIEALATGIGAAIERVRAAPQQRSADRAAMSA